MPKFNCRRTHTVLNNLLRLAPVTSVLCHQTFLKTWLSKKLKLNRCNNCTEFTNEINDQVNSFALEVELERCLVLGFQALNRTLRPADAWHCNANGRYFWELSVDLPFQRILMPISIHRIGYLRDDWNERIWMLKLHVHGFRVTGADTVFVISIVLVVSKCNSFGRIHF